MSQKKYYMDMVNLLVPTALFAGSLTIVVQFLIPCSEPHLASLLALASELFLGSIAGLLIVFLLLYGFWDADIIQDGPKPARFWGQICGRHSLVVTQIVIVGLMIAAAILVLGVAVIVLGNRWTGGFGLGLIFFMFVGAMLVGLMIKKNKYVRVDECSSGPCDLIPIHDVQRHLTKLQGTILALFLFLEMAIMAILLGVGIWQAIDPPMRKCNTNNLSPQWPSILAVSEVNPQTNPLATFTDVDTVLSITLTNNDLVTSQTDTILTTTFIEISTTITTTITDRNTASTFSSPLLIEQLPGSTLSTISILSSSCVTCTPFKTGTSSFIIDTIISTIPCTTKSVLRV